MISTNDEHSRNAWFPIELTEEGIIKLVIDAHSLNALSPIERIPFGILMFFVFLQPLKQF